MHYEFSEVVPDNPTHRIILGTDSVDGSPQHFIKYENPEDDGQIPAEILPRIVARAIEHGYVNLADLFVGYMAGVATLPNAEQIWALILKQIVETSGVNLDVDKLMDAAHDAMDEEDNA